MEDRTKKIIDASETFAFQYNESREKVKEEYEKNESEIHHAFRKTIDGLIILIMDNVFGKYDDPSEKFLYQLNLTVSYVRTHFIINDLVLNGDIIEAYTLIRKQLEKLTRLNELDSKPIGKLLLKTPNVLNLFGEAGKGIYPELSETAHFSHPRVSEFLSFESKDGKKGPSLFPSYKKSAIICYDRNAYVTLYFVSWLIDFVKEINPRYNNQKDVETFLMLEQMALDCNIIRVKEK